MPSNYQHIIAENYELYEAIADLIDNSIASNAKNIWFDCNPEGFIRIIDDGDGMSESRLAQALSPNPGKELKSRLNNDQGVFGQGLKLPLKFFSSISVFSKTKKNNVTSQQIAHETNTLTNIEWEVKNIDLSDRVKSPNCKFLSLNKGTCVLLEKPTSIIYVEDQYNHRPFQRLGNLAKAHISLIFHKYIESKQIKIWYQNGHEEILPTNPLPKCISYDNLVREKIKFETGMVEFRSYIRHIINNEDDDPDINKYKNNVAGYKDKLSDFDGLYIYRADRLIQAGGMSNIPSQIKLNERTIIILDYPFTYHSDYQLNRSKSKIGVPKQIQTQFNKAINLTVERAKPYRKNSIREQKNKKNDSVTTIWIKGNTTKYMINEEHPLIKLKKSGKINSRLVNLIEKITTIYIPNNKAKNIPCDHCFNENDRIEIKALTKTLLKFVSKNNLCKFEPYNNMLKPLEMYY